MDLSFPPAEWKALIDTGAKVDNNRLTIPPEAFAVFVPEAA